MILISAKVHEELDVKPSSQPTYKDLKLPLGAYLEDDVYRSQPTYKDLKLHDVAHLPHVSTSSQPTYKDLMRHIGVVTGVKLLQVAANGSRLC